jgi:hypothetical protein
MKILLPVSPTRWDPMGRDFSGNGGGGAQLEGCFAVNPVSNCDVSQCESDGVFSRGFGVAHPV